MAPVKCLILGCCPFKGGGSVVVTLFLRPLIVCGGSVLVTSFWYSLLCVLSSFAIILMKKRELIAFLLLSFGCLVTVNRVWLLLAVGAVSWSAMCECGISCSCSLIFSSISIILAQFNLRISEILPLPFPCYSTLASTLNLWRNVKVRKKTKIRNRYNQALHLTEDTTCESD